MKNLVIILLIALSFSGRLFSSEVSDIRDSKINAVSDSIISMSTDEEFKKAVIKILQKSNATNVDMFLDEIIEIQKGKAEEQEKLYWVQNIGRNYKNKDMNGWDVALSGILVVFAGLILIALVVHAFNFVLKEKPQRRKAVVKAVPKAVMSPAVQEEIPIEHVIALAAAVELYFRLYIHRSTSGPTFSSHESTSWKIGSKIGIRKIQRKWL